MTALSGVTHFDMDWHLACQDLSKKVWHAMVACKRTLLAGHSFVDLNNDSKPQKTKLILIKSECQKNPEISTVYLPLVKIVRLTDKGTLNLLKDTLKFNR